MKQFFLFCTLFCSTTLFAQADMTKHSFYIDSSYFSSRSKPKIFVHSNIKSILSTYLNKTINFPAQLITMTGVINDPSVNCSTFSDVLEQFNLPQNELLLMGVSICSKMEESTIIEYSALIEPLTEEIIPYLKLQLDEMKKITIYGIPLKVQSVKNIMVLFELASGTEKSDVFKTNYTLHKALSFNNLAELELQFVPQLVEQLFSNKIELIIAFMSKWIDTYHLSFYLNALTISSDVHAEYKVVLLTEYNEAYLFPLFQQFVFDCSVFPNEKCLESSLRSL